MHLRKLREQWRCKRLINQVKNVYTKEHKAKQKYLIHASIVYSDGKSI